MISSPWAKLIRLMIPKISATPSANSAYRLPSETASMTFWIRRRVGEREPSEPEVGGLEFASRAAARRGARRARSRPERRT